jgi:hypothetical protein
MDTLYVDYSTSDRSWFATPSAQMIAASQRDALIQGAIGVLGALLFIGAGLIARERKTGTEG